MPAMPFHKHDTNVRDSKFRWEAGNKNIKTRIALLRILPRLEQ